MRRANRTTHWFVVWALALAVTLPCQSALSAEPPASPPTEAAANVPETLVAELVKTFPAEEATQGVAVDAEHFYAIANSRIGKYRRDSGERVAVWEADAERPLKHLNAGIVYDNRLFCAHSNYPTMPSTSSIELFDTGSMEHVDTHSVGIYEGSLTWVNRQHNTWWAVFAHYSRPLEGKPVTRGHEYTSLVRFDKHWSRQAAYVFPPELLAKFAPDSCSGGYFINPSTLLCTGHDAPEVYELQLPKAASTLVWKRTYSLPELTGQAIACPAGEPLQVWGINRPKRQVVVHRLPEVDEGK